MSDISGIKSKYKIFQNPKYEYKLTKEIESEGINYECYDVYINDLMIYDTKVTIVKKENGIEQVVHRIRENPEFQKGNKDIIFDKSAINGYNIGEATLVYYFVETDNKYNLVWKVKARQDNDNYLLFINSSSGEIIKKSLGTRKSTETGSVITLYNGTQTFSYTKIEQWPFSDSHRLSYDYLTAGGWGYNKDIGEYEYYRPWSDDDNNWTGRDVTYATAFWTLQKAQYFFKNVLSYNYSNYGTVDVNIDSDVSIAEYNPTTKEILYSFPDSGVYNSPASIDILAHEYGHHIISTISNGLDDSYYMEPGAINEGYADIFGKSVQNYIEGYNVNRIEIMGEDVIISDLILKRSCNNPNSMGMHFVGSSSTPILGQPDTYQGTYWYNGFHDQGGVHVNNGVINFWFYLLTKGGVGVNDFNDSYSVSGIGIDKGAKIVYNSLPLLLFESEFTDARNATILAAENLYGIGSNESQQVLNAWEAVSVDGNCLSSEIVAPAIICSSGTSVYINNPPNGATIIWNNSSNISRVSAQGSNPCTFSGTSNGAGWIEAIINSDCGNNTLPRNNVCVVASAPTISSTWSEACNCYVSDPLETFTTYGWDMITCNTSTNTTDYVWEVWGYELEMFAQQSESTNGTRTTYPYTAYGKHLSYTFYDEQYYTIKAKQKMCGSWSSWANKYITVGDDLLMVIAPNPTSGETILSIESSSEKTKLDENTVWEIEIYGPTQTLKEKITNIKGNSTTIQTQSWKEGVYVVRVKYNPDGKQGEILTGKMVVKK